MESWSLIFIEFQVCKMKRVLGIGCTTVWMYLHYWTVHIRVGDMIIFLLFIFTTIENKTTLKLGKCQKAALESIRYLIDRDKIINLEEERNIVQREKPEPFLAQDIRPCRKRRIFVKWWKVMRAALKSWHRTTALPPSYL